MGIEANTAACSPEGELESSCCVEEAEAAERHANADHAADEQTRTSRWPKRTVPSIRNEEEVERCEPDRLRSPSACAEVCKSSAEEPRS